MKNFKPLNDEEQKIIQQAQRIMGNSSTIPCTACRYCTKGCPKNIPIPEFFSAANKDIGNGQKDQAFSDYQNAVKGMRKASDCIDCKQCERACPQHIKITDHLKKCAEMLEK